VSGLPGTDVPAFVDEHRTTIDAPRDRVWPKLRRYADSLGAGPRNPLPWLLGTEPRSGFEISDEVPGERLGLSGRHRFSRYLLVFEVADDTAAGTTLTAQTYADFPGLRGRIYRALVIGTRLHVVAIRGMFRSIRSASVRT